MSINMADKMKRVLTAKALQAIQELDQEGCVTTLDLGVRLVFFFCIQMIYVGSYPLCR
jgi:hypothetical protein